MLGPTLFIYYINDLPLTVDCDLKIFADDTKAYSAVQDEEMKIKLQCCIDKLVEWTNDWLLQFNSDKCKILHLGKNNNLYSYFIKHGSDYHQLQSTVAEKDLGVIVDPYLDFDGHINEVVKKANKIAGLLTRTISYKIKDIMIPLYKALVRPILEYANPVWHPILKKHINLIEGVQRRFTKKIIGCSDLTYEDRLASLSLPSLEYRRMRGDLIEVYKIVHQLYDPCTTQSLLTFSNNEITRGHDYKLTKISTNTRLFQSFFTNRIINRWNKLPSEAVCASSLNAFKNQIDKLFKDQIYSTELSDEFTH